MRTCYRRRDVDVSAACVRGQTPPARPLAILGVALSLVVACAAEKKPPTPFDTDWSFCRFPPSASPDVKRAWVKVKVTVNADGAPVWAVPIASSDPAFEAHAMRCILNERFEPALNEQGDAITEDVTMTMRFVR